MQTRELTLLDLDGENTATVEIEVDRAGKKVWVNIDGVCRLRCCRAKVVVVQDDRKTQGA